MEMSHIWVSSADRDEVELRLLNLQTVAISLVEHALASLPSSTTSRNLECRNLNTTLCISRAYRQCLRQGRCQRLRARGLHVVLSSALLSRTPPSPPRSPQARSDKQQVKVRHRLASDYRNLWRHVKGRTAFGIRRRTTSC